MTSRTRHWRAVSDAAGKIFERGLSRLPDEELRQSISVVLEAGLQRVEVLVDQGTVRASLVLGATPFDVQAIVLGDVLFLQMRFLAFWTFLMRRLASATGKSDSKESLNLILREMTGDVGSELLAEMERTALPSATESIDDLLAVTEVMSDETNLRAAWLLWNDVARTLKHPSKQVEAEPGDPLARLLTDREFSCFADLISRLMQYCSPLSSGRSASG